MLPLYWLISKRILYNTQAQENHQPTFGPHPDMTLNYNFEDEVQQLPLKFNMGNAPLNKEQQDQLLNLIYKYKDVFSLHNEDSGFCDKPTHTITTATDKPVFHVTGLFLDS